MAAKSEISKIATQRKLCYKNWCKWKRILEKQRERDNTNINVVEEKQEKLMMYTPFYYMGGNGRVLLYGLIGLSSPLYLF